MDMLKSSLILGPSLKLTHEAEAAYPSVMRVVVLIMALFPALARADDGRVQFYAAPALVESGLVQHIRPRFSLKTQVGVDLVDDPAAADLLIWDQGRPLFNGLDAVWRFEVIGDHEGAQRFADWLVSDVGKNTIYSFAPDGDPLFSEPQVEQADVIELPMSGDAVLGQAVSFDKCGRCHVTETERRMVSIGSAPSFAVLRSLNDWEYRFAAFYVLKPHPAFTQVQDLTDPFPADRPSPISPIELTLDELDALLAYAETMAPADLGQPLVHQ